VLNPRDQGVSEIRLEADRLACERGERLVFEDVGFAVSSGDILSVRGPNGSGKSTLLRLLAGFLRPVEGSVFWNGESVFGEAEDFRARVCYVGHLDPIKLALTVRENIDLWTGLGGNSGNVDEALAAFALDNLADLPARYLSSGQRRRLNLARLVAEQKPLWLLDEPTVGLDDDSVDRLQVGLGAHRDAGGIAVIATHSDLSVGPVKELLLGRTKELS